jgi:hypothetical protein
MVRAVICSRSLIMIFGLCRIVWAHLSHIPSPRAPPVAGRHLRRFQDPMVPTLRPFHRWTNMLRNRNSLGNWRFRDSDPVSSAIVCVSRAGRAILPLDPGIVWEDTGIRKRDLRMTGRWRNGCGMPLHMPNPWFDPCRCKFLAKLPCIQRESGSASGRSGRRHQTSAPQRGPRKA